MKNRVSGKIANDYLHNYFNESISLLKESLNILQSEMPKSLKGSGNVYFSKLKNFVIGGKKVRGSLVMLGYLLAHGKSHETAMRLSIAIELFHAALLIHDDIMDHDDLRRGIPNLHLQYSELALGADFEKQQYGNSMALLMGDLLFFYSLKIIAELNLKLDVYKKVTNLFTDNAVHIAYGQMMDILPKSLAIIDSKRIYKTMELKTAEYTGFTPLAIGALAAGIKDESLVKLKKYGLALGWAFQIQDDILSIFGTEDQIGKPVGSDLREGKLTLLQLMLYERGDIHQRRIQQSILGNENLSFKDIEVMRGLLIELGVYEDVKKIGWKYVKSAQSVADKIDTNLENKELMKSLASFMMERVK